MAAGGWGSYYPWEWGGRTVSPHPHAHSTTTFDFLMARETFTHSPLRRPHDFLFTSTHRIYLVFTPANTFSSPCLYWTLTHIQFASSGLSVHPRAEVELLIFTQGPLSIFFVPTHRLLSGLVSCSQEIGVVSTHSQFSHTEESSAFQPVFGSWCEYSLTHWVLHCCYSRCKLGVVLSLSPTIFLWKAILHSGTMCKFSLLICGLCICISLCILGSGASFPHAHTVWSRVPHV